MQNDTIYAPATTLGGAIAVIRISGPEARRTVRLLSRDVTETPARLCPVRLVDQGETVDACMAVFFPAPHSYTGEDTVELHCHGGAGTVQRALMALATLGFRPAAGGEFTKRAFLAGKMELCEAEAVMDLVTATAEQSRKAALWQLDGSVGREVHGVETLIIDALSGIDAALDYPDEAEADATANLPALLKSARARVEALLCAGRRGRVLRDGLRVAILGRPNVGKSSLLNALLGRERAIVTASAGTTRDVLEEETSFSGVPVRLIDTAGLRDASDEAERIGVSRARAAMETADVLLIVLEGGEPLEEADRALLAETAHDTRRIVLVNKGDLVPAWPLDALLSLGVAPDEIETASAVTGEGLPALQKRILLLAAPSDGDCTALTNERHLHLLETALTALRAAAATAELDCVATDLRDALRALGGITGTNVDAEVIDRIFARFCVGK